MRLFTIVGAGCLMSVPTAWVLGSHAPIALSAGGSMIAKDSMCTFIDHAIVKTYQTPLRSHIVRKSTGALSEGPHRGFAQIAGPGATCAYVRDEPVNGEAASVYRQDVKPPVSSGVTSTLIWISKSSGLPLRQEQDIDFGKDGKGHESLLYNWAKP